MANKIHVLDAYLANQISAGEVVERPNSVIKELLENSLDAKANNIDIILEQGGIELIKIRDNGCGIAKEDLPLALQRHATSKICHVDDLFFIKSLGFRGEALASISSVSKTTITSRTTESDLAWQIKFNIDNNLNTINHQNNNFSLIPSSHPYGTTIEVANLFYNVPARRKFLRTPTTELSHIMETIRRIALFNYDKTFTVQHNNKNILRYLACDNDKAVQQRLSEICGNDFQEKSIYIGTQASDISIRGWLGLPTFSRTQNDLQHFYLNGRYIKDKIIFNAVKQAYQDVIAPQRFPALVLFIEINPELVDVNVHPTKNEVRFRDSRSVHNFITSVLRKNLAQGTSILKDVLDLEQTNNEYLNLDKKSDYSNNSNTSTLNETFLIAEPFIVYNNLIDNTTDNITTHPKTSTSSISATLEQHKLPWEYLANEDLLPDLFAKQSSTTNNNHNNNLAIKENKPISDYNNKNIHESNKQHKQHVNLGNAIAQIFSNYILAQNDDGLIVIDAHAGHERITYEKLKQQFWQQSIQKQKLIKPITVNLSSQEMEYFELHQHTLEQTGLDLRISGNNLIVVASIPMLLINADIPQLIHDILADFIIYETSSSIEQITNKILTTIACHSSVRSGRTLTINEMNALLHQIETTENSDQCGHGRPTWLKLTNLNELQKMFLRK